MFEHLFIALAGVALVFTLASTHPLWDRETRVIWAGIAMITWGLWGAQAGRVVAVSGGETVTESHISLVALGWILAFIMFVMIVLNVMELLRRRRRNG